MALLEDDPKTGEGKQYDAAALEQNKDFSNFTKMQQLNTNSIFVLCLYRLFAIWEVRTV